MPDRHRVRLVSAAAALVIPSLLMTTAAAAEVFEARVIDKTTGKPIPNAEVTILGHPGERFSDGEGRVSWSPAPPPPFEVLVVLPGGVFTKPVLVERLPASGVLDVPVESMLSESVTVAAGAAPSIETTPASGATLLTAAEVLTRAPVNLTQALENVAGVSSVSEGQAAVPVVRGFASGRTLILVDGARVTSERRVGPSATFLDPFVLESVEVSRGPGSVAYGSDAFGGVISARTRRVAPGSPLGFRFAGTLGAGTPQARAGFEVTKGVPRGSMLVQAHVRSFDDYRSPDGDVLNSGAQDTGFLVRGEHALGNGIFSASWQSDFGRDVERPRNNSDVVRFYYPTEDSHRMTVGYEQLRVRGLDRISLTGFYGSSAVVTDQDRFATATSPRSIERADVSARDYQVRVLAERGIGKAHVELGADVNGRFDLEAIDESVFYDLSGALVRTDSTLSIEDARRNDTGLFASAQYPLSPRLMVAGGVRGDLVTDRNSGGFFGDRSTSEAAASGYGSVTVSLHRISISGQVARGFRAPTLSDRYFRGPSGRGFITGNPDLEPETSLQFDTAVRFTGERWRAALYLFNYRISDLIERYEEETDFFFFRNRGRARVRGVEIESQGDLGRGFTLELAGQVTRGRALDDDEYLDTIPAASLSAQVRKQLSTRGFAQLRVGAYARDTRPGPTERATPGYAVVDASGGWKLSDALEIRILGRNLLDREYLVSPDRRTVLAPGASLIGMVMTKF
jgi:hemoglobin/transferrin/lactoferrin receptor protein